MRNKQYHAANDQVQVALIGSGGMGVADATTCITVPGVKLVAVCDLYDGRIAEAKSAGETTCLLPVIIRRY